MYIYVGCSLFCRMKWRFEIFVRRLNWASVNLLPKKFNSSTCVPTYLLNLFLKSLKMSKQNIFLISHKIPATIENKPNGLYF